MTELIRVRHLTAIQSGFVARARFWRDTLIDAARAIWTEHRLFFTLNPCVYSASLCRLGWPQRWGSELYFGCQLIIDPEVRFAFWCGTFAR